MFLILLNPPPPPLTFLKPKPKLLLLPPTKFSLKPLNSTKLPSLLHSNPTTTQKPHHHPLSQTLQSLNSLKPYLLAQAKPILAGWLCGLVSVFSLSKLVPKVGKLSTVLTNVDALRLRDEGLVLGALVLARLVASYWQQALLWDAALNAVYRIRCYVFERVLERDLAFFECGDGSISAGDIAYRITAEAADVADTVHAVLNVSEGFLCLFNLCHGCIFVFMILISM
jgi:putative ABC transport system ATP-binding protein